MATKKKFEINHKNRSTLPKDSKERKRIPIGTGFLDYFPDAAACVSNVSFKANEQHNPGEPMHWARGKSDDHADTMIRHFTERGTFDNDGLRHSAKMAWRAMAILQLEIEKDSGILYKTPINNKNHNDGVKRNGATKARS